MTRTLAILLLTTPLVLPAASSAAEAPSPPWPPQYKIKPGETDRLTAADVVGPDGIVYPDWRYAGIPGGIPDVPAVARIEDFGARPDDGKDDSPALAAGAAAVGKRGGGALILESGTYHLDRPVTITHDNVVIRGQGMDATRIVFCYGVPDGVVRFFQPADGETIGPENVIEIHAAPDGLRRIALEADGKVVTENVRSTHWGGTYVLRVTGDTLTRRMRPGEHRLKAVAEWDGGREAQSEITVRLDPKHRPGDRGNRRYLGHKDGAAILFTGGPPSGPSWKLAQDGKRGETELVLETAPNLKPGDAIVVTAPATERWNKLVRNACKWGIYRSCQFRVEKVEGNRVRLNQPLRYDFPVVDGTTVRRLDPIRRCGVENLALEQTQKLWTCGVLFSNAWECWARGVKVHKAGRYPVYTREAKWCEIRDCQFDDAWYHGGGGTAYAGWERSYDCLMDNVTTRRMRHAPCVQWSSSGNVIRCSTFHQSDAQWHAGWTNENLFEQCTVDAATGTGSYGNGGWASPPGDTAHGPEGPRNVVYNCDLRAPKTGLWMGGMNEAWLILYNRIRADSGPGIYARTFSFDHTIRGNVIALKSPKQPALHLATADCTGIEITANRIHGGNGRLLAGPGKPALAQNNSFHPYTDAPSRPDPPVPSIFQWQRQHKPLAASSGR